MRVLLSLLGLGACLWCWPVSLAADNVTRLTFAQLADSLKANMEVTQHIQFYNGTAVEMQGFIIPAGPPDLTFFLLSRVSAIGNYCCELPTGQDETIYVSTARGVKIFYDPLRIYKVRGLFEAGAKTDPIYGVSLFRLRQAQVEEAVGAKMIKMDQVPAVPDGH